MVLTVPEWSDELNHFVEDVLGFRWFGSGGDVGKRRFYRPKRNFRTHAIGYSIVPGVAGLQHVGIEVENLDDVGVAYDLVQERGYPLMATLGRHTRDPVISFYSFTPSGFPLEYIQGRHRGQRGPPLRRGQARASLGVGAQVQPRRAQARDHVRPRVAGCSCLRWTHDSCSARCPGHRRTGRCAGARLGQPGHGQDVGRGRPRRGCGLGPRGRGRGDP
ncbi:VOC family protein [Janibacter limosus]|uniref:VOC family protein n=1 Tax=Janibacter limosus TaxID=53458 RepID=A0AC61U5B7_9MICO|nr:VOC family protein [Janibacter limosus]UUZ45242.1 VOC family protein [Janibacter limosus]